VPSVPDGLSRSARKEKKGDSGLGSGCRSAARNLDGFIGGTVAEDEFVKTCGEDWQYFADGHSRWLELLRFMGKSKFRIEPLETNELSQLRTLVQGHVTLRDAAAARKIDALIKELKDGDVLVVIYGFCHLLGKGHLAECVGTPGLKIVPYAPGAYAAYMQDHADEKPEALWLGKDLACVQFPRDPKTLAITMDELRIEKSREELARVEELIYIWEREDLTPP